MKYILTNYHAMGFHWILKLFRILVLIGFNYFLNPSTNVIFNAFNHMKDLRVTNFDHDCLETSCHLVLYEYDKVKGHLVILILRFHPMP